VCRRKLCHCPRAAGSNAPRQQAAKQGNKRSKQTKANTTLASVAAPLPPSQAVCAASVPRTPSAQQQQPRSHARARSAPRREACQRGRGTAEQRRGAAYDAQQAQPHSRRHATRSTRTHRHTRTHPDAPRHTQPATPTPTPTPTPAHTHTHTHTQRPTQPHPQPHTHTHTDRRRRRRAHRQHPLLLAPHARAVGPARGAHAAVKQRLPVRRVVPLQRVHVVVHVQQAAVLGAVHHLQRRACVVAGRACVTGCAPGGPPPRALLAWRGGHVMSGCVRVTLCDTRCDARCDARRSTSAPTAGGWRLAARAPPAPGLGCTPRRSACRPARP
jgi:hypothetical protein